MCVEEVFLLKSNNKKVKSSEDRNFAVERGKFGPLTQILRRKATENFISKSIDSIKTETNFRRSISRRVFIQQLSNQDQSLCIAETKILYFSEKEENEKQRSYKRNCTSSIAVTTQKSISQERS